MPSSLIYNSYMDDVNKNNIDPATDTFYAMLVHAYTPDKDAHTKRSDVTSTEVSGTGYTAGGKQSVQTLTKDNTNDRSDLGFADVTWATSSVTASGAVIYKHRGGLSSADELVAYIDFGGDVTSAGTTFTFHPTSPLRMQN